jgi:hypothetical protein
MEGVCQPPLLANGRGVQAKARGGREEGMCGVNLGGEGFFGAESGAARHRVGV